MLMRDTGNILIWRVGVLNDHRKLGHSVSRGEDLGSKLLGVGGGGC